MAKDKDDKKPVERPADLSDVDMSKEPKSTEHPVEEEQGIDEEDNEKPLVDEPYTGDEPAKIEPGSDNDLLGSATTGPTGGPGTPPGGHPLPKEPEFDTKGCFCNTCIFWCPNQSSKGDRGECRINPPLYIQQSSTGKWPMTKNDQWCGHHPLLVVKVTDG